MAVNPFSSIYNYVASAVQGPSKAPLAKAQEAEAKDTFEARAAARSITTNAVNKAIVHDMVEGIMTRVVAKADAEQAATAKVPAKTVTKTAELVKTAKPAEPVKAPEAAKPASKLSRGIAACKAFYTNHKIAVNSAACLAGAAGLAGLFVVSWPAAVALGGAIGLGAAIFAGYKALQKRNKPETQVRNDNQLPVGGGTYVKSDAV